MNYILYIRKTSRKTSENTENAILILNAQAPQNNSNFS